MTEKESTSSGENTMQLSLSSLVDDFTHVSADKYMSSSFTKSQYSQVVFHGLSEVYPSDSDIKCTYYLTDVKPQAGDKIAIFKVGWSSVSDFITFERAQVPMNVNSPLEVTFKADTLPKNYEELYQLCYVTSGNVIAGASTPFSFRKPHESELVAVEDPSDPELIIFRSRVTQLQDEMEKKSEERDSLYTKYQILDDKFAILKKEFDKCEIELKNARDQVRELISKQEDLINNIQKLEKCLEEKDAEILCLNTAHVELKEKHKTLAEEKEMTSRELQELQKCIDKNEEQIQSLNDLRIENRKLIQEKNELCGLLEGCRIDLQKRKDQIDFLTQEKTRLERSITEHSLANDNLMLEVGSLKLKLRDISEKHNKATAEVHSLNIKLMEEIKVNKKLTCEIAQQMSALNSDSNGEAYLQCKEEKDMFQAQFENLKEHHAKCDQLMQDKLDELNKQFETERSKLIDEKNELIAKIDEYMKLCHCTASQSSSQKRETQNFKEPRGELFELFNEACSPFSKLFDNEPRKVKDKGSDIEDVVKEKLKNIQQAKAELRDSLIQEKHKCAELERILVETNEETAALKSRIQVLEYELAMLKSTTDASSVQPYLSNQNLSEQLDSLHKCLPIIQTFNDNVTEQKLFEQRIQQEKANKALLQSKVEFLLQEDAKMSNKLQDLMEKYEKLYKEKEELCTSVTAENVTVLQKVLDENDKIISELKSKLAEAINERDKFEKLSTDLRKELIGKVSVDTHSEYKLKIASLEKELHKKVSDCKYMAKFIQERFRDENGRSCLSCPLCPSEFRPTSREEFVNHFESHLF